MQLSKKQKTFFEFFALFLKSISHFGQFLKMPTVTDIHYVTSFQTHGECSCQIFYHIFSSLWGKSRWKMSLQVTCEIFSFLLTHWLQMIGIFSVIMRSFHNQFKCNCLKYKKHFLNILLHFWNMHHILTFFKKWRPS